MKNIWFAHKFFLTSSLSKFKFQPMGQVRHGFVAPQDASFSQMHKKNAKIQGMSLRHNFINLTAMRTSSNSLYSTDHDSFLKYFHKLLDSTPVTPQLVPRPIAFSPISSSPFLYGLRTQGKGFSCQSTHQEPQTHSLFSLGAVFTGACAISFRLSRKKTLIEQVQIAHLPLAKWHLLKLDLLNSNIGFRQLQRKLPSGVRKQVLASARERQLVKCRKDPKTLYYGEAECIKEHEAGRRRLIHPLSHSDTSVVQHLFPIILSTSPISIIKQKENEALQHKDIICFSRN